MKKTVSLFFILFPLMLFAAELKISVIDKDLDFPLEGALITLEGKSGVRAFADENGSAVLLIPDSLSSGTVRVSLLGYKDARVNFSKGQTQLALFMSLSDVIEGKELLVKRAAPEKTEVRTGVAAVMNEEEMHTTANIGLAEDCMAALRTLPGVSFSGAWGSEPSVRGGEPRETACLLDGMYTVYPWHWGGGVSIFNPSMVESIKLSNGVYSARYGRASSGIIEATTLTPDYENYHVNACLSTTCADAFFQVPFGKDVGGMLLGAHVSFLDPLFWAYEASGSSSLDMIERPPYIRDFFFKTNLTPSPELKVSLVGFFGSDGISLDQEEEDDGVKSSSVMDYDIYQALAGVNVSYLASDKVLFHGLFSYNGMFEDMEMKVRENGWVRYNDEFVEEYASVFPAVTFGAGYNLNNLESSYIEKIKNHLVSGRLEGEIQASERNLFTVGVEGTFSKADTEEKSDMWTDIEIGQERMFKKIKLSSEIDGNSILDNAAFLTWTFGNSLDLIQSEVGIRGEFIQMWNRNEGYNLRFIPDICPRASVTFTPVRDSGGLEKVSFTAGSGLFVSIPRETMIFTKDMGLSDFDMNTNRAILALLGGDVDLSGGWKFKLETYFKYYLSRIYSYSVTDEASGFQDGDIEVKTDGKGRVFGVDAMVEKKSGGKWDGYLSYSFLWSRFKNPAGIQDGQYAEGMYENPLDQWYYPEYHRFHTLNLVSNWHFAKGWTFTVKGTLASGTPKEDSGDVTCYAARMDDGTVLQRYTRSSVYSDSSRNSISCPVDLRLSYQWKTNRDKASWEVYFAVQDVFVNLYTPRGEKSFNRYTGKMSDVAESADFNIGVPIPSLGLKVKF